MSAYVITGLLTKFLHLDHNTSLMFASLISEVDFKNHLFIYFAIFLGVCYLIFKSLKFFNFKTHTEIVISDKEMIYQFDKYIKINENYFTVSTDYTTDGWTNKINEKKISYNLDFSNEDIFFSTSKVYFNIPDIGKGYLYYKFQNYEKNETDENKKTSTDKFYLPNLHVVMYNKNLPEKLYKTITKFLEEEDQRNKVIYNISYLKGNGISRSKIPRKKHIKIFSQKMRNIFNFAVKVHEDDQIFEKFSDVRCSFIFHGPPGCGKSSLFYAVADKTSRHIINLNLLIFKSKEDFEETLRSPRCGGETSKVVFVIDEIDVQIFKMIERETKKSEKKEEKKNPNVIEINTGDNNKKEEKKKEEFMTVGDILTALQGVVPFLGLILFAATNNFDKMINHPEYGERLKSIFRHGRMTPVECEPLNCEIFDELCEYYFNKKVNSKYFDFSDHSISSVIEEIKNCLVNGISFEEFIKKLKF